MNSQASEKPGQSPAGSAFTDLVFEAFRLNGRLLAAGDAFTQDLGLSSARWQILSAIGEDGAALTVAQLARNQGMSRQAVQRLADALAADWFVEFVDNPNHRRAKLVRLSAKGRSALHEINRRQAAWANNVAGALTDWRLRDTLTVLRSLREKLEADAR